MKKLGLLLAISAFLFANEFNNSATVAVSSKSGNTNIMNYALGFSSESEGDISLFGIPLEDSELSFSIGHARGSYQETLLENNGQVNVIFDYHANRRFSPFIFVTAEYDSMANLERRANVGLGAKWRFNAYLSLSVAGLFEQELYTGEDINNFGRLSIRPKYKKTYDSGISVSWIYFYQPAFNDFSNFLMSNSISVNIKTQVDWLSISATAKHLYNSQPPTGTEKRDVSASLGFTASF